MRHNDPGNLALQEVSALYPLVDEPSLVISLGTGSRRSPDVPRMSPSRGIFRDGFIPRLLRAFSLSMSSLNGHKFRSHRSNGRREQYFRFDSEFEGPEPALDDTTSTRELKAAARAAIYDSRDIDRAASCAVGQLFVFQLDSEERKDDGQYSCVGHILCRLRADGMALGTLLNQLVEGSAKLSVQSRRYPLEGLIQTGACLDRDGNFRLSVSFEVPDKQSQIFIRLLDNSSESWNISGSPYSIDTLVAAQQSDACFGRADHVKRKRVDPTEAPPRKRRRL